MTHVSERIPDGLRPEVEAALAWWNGRQPTPFEVTGIVDPGAALAQSGEREPRLVLCGGDRCEQRALVAWITPHVVKLHRIVDPPLEAQTRPSGGRP